MCTSHTNTEKIGNSWAGVSKAKFFKKIEFMSSKWKVIGKDGGEGGGNRRTDRDGGTNQNFLHGWIYSETTQCSK